jgi:hypothetical protein
MNAFFFAAGLDWLETLLPLLFVLFWIVSQVVNVFRNVAGRGKPRQPAAPPRPPVERVDDVRADLERQIGEFLKEKAPRRGEPAAEPVLIPPQPKPMPRPLPKPQVSPRPQPPRGKSERLKPAPMPAAGGAASAEASAAQAASSGRLGSLGDHGGDVARHVQDAFAHDLEHRRARPAIAGGPVAARPAPGELAALLQDPNSLRQLFIVREVLDRPIDRWE